MQSVSSIAAQLLEEEGVEAVDFTEYFDSLENTDHGDKVVNHVKNLLNEVIESVISEEDYENNFIEYPDTSTTNEQAFNEQNRISSQVPTSSMKEVKDDGNADNITKVMNNMNNVSKNTINFNI